MTLLCHQKTQSAQAFRDLLAERPAAARTCALSAFFKSAHRRACYAVVEEATPRKTIQDEKDTSTFLLKVPFRFAGSAEGPPSGGTAGFIACLSGLCGVCMSSLACTHGLYLRIVTMVLK